MTTEFILGSVIDEGAPFAFQELWPKLTGNIIWIVEDNTKLWQLYSTLKFLLPEALIYHFPAWDTAPYDRLSPSTNLIHQRIETLANLPHTKGQKRLLLLPVASLLQLLPPREEFQDSLILLKKGQNLNTSQLTHTLIQLGFMRVNTALEAGEFAIRGNIIDIVAAENNQSWRLDLFGDRLENIYHYNPSTQTKGEHLTHLRLLPTSEVIFTTENIELLKQNYYKSFGEEPAFYHSLKEHRHCLGLEQWLAFFYSKLESILDYFPPESIITNHLTSQLIEKRYQMIWEYYKSKIVQHEPVIAPNLFLLDAAEINRIKRFKFHPFHTKDGHNFNYQYITDSECSNLNFNLPSEELKPIIARITKPKLIACKSFGARERLQAKLKQLEVKVELINQFDEIKTLASNKFGLLNLALDRGINTNSFLIFTEKELFSSRQHKAHFIYEAINEGELVVHRQYGVGKFIELKNMSVQDITQDYLVLEYAGGDKLYIPAINIDLITRYGSKQEAQLDRLGSGSWAGRKSQLEKKLYLVATELLDSAAMRATKTIPSIIPIEEEYSKFCDNFPHKETRDQLQATADIEKDLASGHLMDRIIIGDVGFGKTEVAMRAAFMVVRSKRIPNHDHEASTEDKFPRQVAIIAPTTLLVNQHYNNFIQRFSGFDVKIAQLSRSVSSKQVKQIKAQLAKGEIDIIIGTHILLSDTISFYNLTLLIIDEEHQFGVHQKDKLKTKHILLLSATPIPRTLQMSLNNIKSLSLLTEPPLYRLPVKTILLPYEPHTIREALLHEYYRGGRSFYVAPRIEELDQIEQTLRKLVPELRLITVHGKMAGIVVEKIMEDFCKGLYDVLLTTTIIESGLDIAEANTIIIHKANMFGLAELYQLRGRVGRGKIRGYAYITTPNSLKTDALERLKILQKANELGAGFTIATQDMELRGYGNLIGKEQSGHVKEVGLELYNQLLQEAIDKLKLETDLESPIEPNDCSPVINLNIAAILPDDYITNTQVRLNYYKNLSQIKTEDEIEELAVKLIDNFGTLPSSTETLLSMAKLKLSCKKLWIEKLEVTDKMALIKFTSLNSLNPESLIAYVQDNILTAKLLPDNKLAIKLLSTPSNRVEKITALLHQLNKFLLGKNFISLGNTNN